MTWIPGKFPNGATAALCIHATGIKGIKGIKGMDWFAAFVFVDDNGKIVHTVQPPSFGIEHIQPNFTIDLDGDGFDEMIFESIYYEGAYTLLLQWKDGKPVLESLTGDGA